MKDLVFSFALLLSGTATLAQSSAGASQTAPLRKGAEQVRFKTSAVCDMCKARIEKSVVYEKGVQAATLDVASKVLTVTYNPAKTTPAALRTAVQKTGYDADELTADARAYDRLPDCCKKTAEPHQ